MDNKPILTTTRLYLRHFTINDALLIIQLNTAKVLQYVHEALPQNLDDAKRIIQEIILPQYNLYQLGRFAVHVKEDNRFIGWCGLKYLQDENEIDLGYRFLEKEWGNGFATEAATTVLQWGFIERKVETIIGRTHIDNIASQNVLQKIGMKFTKETMEDAQKIKIFSKSFF